MLKTFYISGDLMCIPVGVWSGELECELEYKKPSHKDKYPFLCCFINLRDVL